VMMAKFKKSDRIAIMFGSTVNEEGIHVYGRVVRTGTVEDVPHTSRGKRYLVRFDSGHLQNGRNLPQQYLYEDARMPIISDGTTDPPPLKPGK